MTTTNQTNKTNAPATSMPLMENAVVTPKPNAAVTPRTAQEELEAKAGKSNGPETTKPGSGPAVSEADKSEEKNKAIADKSAEKQEAIADKSAEKQKDTAKKAGKQAKAYQGAALGLGVAAAAAACVAPPFGAVAGFVLGVCAAIVGLVGKKKAKNAQKKMEAEQAKAAAEQKKVEVNEAKNKAAEITKPEYLKNTQSSASRQLAAVPGVTGSQPTTALKPSVAAKETLVAGKVATGEAATPGAHGAQTNLATTDNTTTPAA